MSWLRLLLFSYVAVQAFRTNKKRQSASKILHCRLYIVYFHCIFRLDLRVLRMNLPDAFIFSYTLQKIHFTLFHGSLLAGGLAAGNPNPV